MGFFRLFKVQNKEKLVWRETHTAAKLEYLCNFSFFLFYFFTTEFRVFYHSQKAVEQLRINPVIHTLSENHSKCRISGFQKLAKIDHLAFLMNFCPLKMQTLNAAFSVFFKHCAVTVRVSIMSTFCHSVCTLKKAKIIVITADFLINFQATIFLVIFSIFRLQTGHP